MGGRGADGERQKMKRGNLSVRLGNTSAASSVTTTRLAAFVAMATGDRQESWREGLSKKSAAVT